MKKIILIIPVLLFTVFFSGCKKFLNVTPIDNLSGNNYWRTRDDVERYTNGLYAMLRTKICQTNNQPFTIIGDLRCAFIGGSQAGAIDIVNNNIKGLYGSSDPSWISNTTRWKEFFDIIQAANIMYAKLDDVPADALSEESRAAYKAEAVFLRNLCYFFMVRLFGDVPYYTNAFNDQPLPRTAQVTVMKNCIADLKAVKDNLPVTYTDPTLLNTRAMRGSAIILLMHMNMWASAFDNAQDLSGYYKQTIELGNELGSYPQYALLELTPANNKVLFKGNTTEGLFEIVANQNRGELFTDRQSPSLLFSYYPYWGNTGKISSSLFYQNKYMELLYPSGLPDLRRDLWFDNFNSNTSTFNLKKFQNTYTTGGDNFIKHEDNLIVFRLADAILLTAEAYAQIGDDNNARLFVNKIRTRANATPIQSADYKLKEDIFFERQRELIGEGQYYFDLVRTKDNSTAPRVTNPNYCKTPIPLGDFIAGGWTVPIDPSALNNNPLMTLNNFWR